VSLSLFRVRAHWEEAVDRQKQQERHLVGILALLLGGTTLAMGAVEFLRPRLPDLAWRDFLIQAVSLGVFLPLVVWWALRRRPEALRLALLTGVVTWAACALGNFPAKAGLQVDHLKYSDRLASPLLLSGLAFLLIWPWLVWLYRRYPEEMRAAGMGGNLPGQQLLAGFLVGLLLCGHVFFSNYYSQAFLLVPRGWLYYFWSSCYEIGFQSWIEEMLFRGWFFAYLYRSRNWGFWRAALATSSLNMLLYLPKHEWTSSPTIMVGLLFYVFLGGMVYAALYRRFGSVWPSYVANATLGVLSAILV
jgi:membrane protease YdiL (CAAX protease family)